MAIPEYVPTLEEIIDQIVTCQNIIGKHDMHPEDFRFSERDYSQFAYLVINLTKFKTDMATIINIFKRNAFIEIFGRVCEEITKFPEEERKAVVIKIAEALGVESSVLSKVEMFQFHQRGRISPSKKEYDWGLYLIDRAKERIPFDIVFRNEEMQIIAQINPYAR